MKYARVMELDALRGIAILMVVFYHYFYRYGQLYQPGSILDFARYGHLGVELFFLISGFVIFYSLLHARSLPLFWIGRVSRIMPAYWVSVTSVFLLTTIFGLHGREVGFTHYLANLTMLQEYLGFKHVDGVYWSLTIEITFYFWVSLFLIKYRHLATPVFLIYPVVLLAIQMSGVDMSRKVEKILLIEYGSLFIAGICYSNIHRKLLVKRSLAVLSVCILTNLIQYGGIEIILVLIFHLLMLLVAVGRASYLLFRPLAYVGGISYSLYLMHQNIGYMLLIYLDQLNLPHWLAAAGVFFLMVGLAHLMVQRVENPLRKIMFQRLAARYG